MSIKQLEERNVPCEITHMVWSDRMDLVALANVKAEVALHRLAWTKAWSLPPPKEGLHVKAITWRPDGKIIAIAYSSGQIILVKVENKGVLHSIETKTDISCLFWVQDQAKAGDKNNQQQYMETIDLSGNFLPEPSPLTFDAPNDEDQKDSLLQNQTAINLLLVGTSDGAVLVSIFGCFPCTRLDVTLAISGGCSVQSIHLNEALTQLFVTIQDTTNGVKLVVFNSEIFNTHINEIFAMALKQIKLNSLINFLSSTITTITESWESILLEMDNKLSKYASKVPEGGVAADFLDLLTFGFCSNAMKEFLIHDLTKKGLEKFGQTIEMSYSNIQKLMLKYVMKYGQNITYHLSELRGMARLEHRYKVLGLNEDAITEAILSNGAFLIKGGEMQQIINNSIINYQAFFRWLYTAIMHVMEEPIPNEIPQMTQQDLAYITEFLQNFHNIGNSERSGFIMERLGQYLSDFHLTIEPDMSGNEWSTFLTQNLCVKNSKSILKHFAGMSLIQQYKHLKEGIEVIFIGPKEALGRHFTLTQTIPCFQYGGVLRTSHINTLQNTPLFTFLHPPNQVHLLQIAPNNTILVGTIDFGQDGPDSNYPVLDVQLYTSAIVSCLLQDTSKTSLLCQVPLGNPLEQLREIGDFSSDIFVGGLATMNCLSLAAKTCHSIDGLIASQFAMSGSRKVGIVLAENRRKIRLYEMEGEEEEEEDADMTNNTLIDSSDMNIS